jgi:hypothetical protein
MGGAQMYFRNKMLYLREHGWTVDIICGMSKNVIIPELREFKNLIPELLFPQYYYSAKCQKKTIKKLAEIINDDTYEEIVIESSIIHCATWAETVANKIGAKHLIFLLQEQNNVTNKKLQDFFVFKYSRRELAGITANSLKEMFREFHSLDGRESYSLTAHCNNVEADVPCELLAQIDRNKYDYIIGALSRLNKPFVPHAVSDICAYATSHPDKRYLLLWIGDAPAGSPELTTVRRMVCDSPNIELVITGYLLPVPFKLLEFCDVFISSSGSSRPCMRSGVPTITYDGNDYRPIGILGRTTNHSLFRDHDEPPKDLYHLLDDVLVYKKYAKTPPNYNSGLPDFKTHLDFLSQSSTEKDYFDFKTLSPTGFMERRICFMLSLIGPLKYLSFATLLRSVRPSLSCKK